MNNDDNGYTIFCPRCGAEMNSNSRYCMKCGYLNPEHETNESMKPYIQENSEAYQVGSGEFKYDNNIGIANNTGNQKFCFIINFVIYILIVLLSTLLITLKGNMDILYIRDSILPIILIVVSIMFLYIYSIELIFIKCNKPWWSGLVPIYNFMVLSDILYKKQILGLITLIPIVGQLYIIVMFYSLGKKFKFSGLLTVLLSFIFIPVMGFSTRLFNNKSYVANLSQKEIESNYKRKRLFLVCIVLFFLIGVGLLVWKNYDSVLNGAETVEKNYYVHAAKKIVKETKEKIEKDKFSCIDNVYKDDIGTYYFTYSDFGDYISLPFYYQREPIEGYVKVDNTSGTSKYYVSLTDGEYGLDEVLIDNITVDDVEEITVVKKLDKNLSIECRVK